MRAEHCTYTQCSYHFFIHLGVISEHSTSVSFSLTQISDTLHCDSSTIHQVLQDLQYNDYNTSQLTVTSSNIMVEFSNPSFHLRSRDISNEEKDLICQQLLDKVKRRENREVERLYQLYSILKCTSMSNHLCNSITNPSLKDLLQLYFNDKLTEETFHTLHIDPYEHLNQPLTERRAILVRNDIRSLLSIHEDQQFTGRSVARILQGISSPCFPAEVWGRMYMYWRKHLNVEFNILCKMATQELIKFNST